MSRRARVRELGKLVWPTSSTGTVNRLWAGGIAGVALGVALEFGLGFGLGVAGVLLLRTAALYAKGAA